MTTSTIIDVLIQVSLGLSGIAYMMPFEFSKRFGAYGFMVTLALLLLRLHRDLQQIITLLEPLT